MIGDWNEAECYIAVWAYDQLDLDRSQVKKHLYRQVSDLIGRTPKAVEYKVQNVAHFDDRPRAEKPISEAPHAQALVGQVFHWYWADRQGFRNLYDYYYQQFQFAIDGQPPAPPEDPAGLVIEEGAPGFETSVRRRRSRKLLEAGREHFRGLDPEGKLRCAACAFVTPEAVQREVVQLHHTEPLHGYGLHGQSLTLEEAVSRLAPLCPTCHQIAHTAKPPLSVGAIADLTGA